MQLFAHALVEEHRVAFAVQVKAAEVHVRRADDAVFSVADDALGVDKAGRVAVNFDAFLDELGVECLRQREHVFFVGDFGDGDAHVHARARGGNQRPLHLPVDDEVGGVDVHISARMVDDFQV